MGSHEHVSYLYLYQEYFEAVLSSLMKDCYPLMQLPRKTILEKGEQSFEDKLRRIKIVVIEKNVKSNLIEIAIVLAVCWMAASFVFVCFGVSVQLSMLWVSFSGLGCF